MTLIKIELCGKRHPGISDKTAQLNLAKHDFTSKQGWNFFLYDVSSAIGIEVWGDPVLHPPGKCNALMNQSSWACLIYSEIQETYHVHFEQAPGSSPAQDKRKIKSKRIVTSSSDEDDMDIDMLDAKRAVGTSGISNRASRSTRQDDKDDEHEDSEEEEDNGSGSKSEQGSQPGSEETCSSGTVESGTLFKSHDGHVLYRIGTWPTHKEALPTEEGAIPMEMIVVAEIRHKERDKEKKVNYRVVESWLVQGICIGHFELGHDVEGSEEIKEMLKEYEPDSLFAEEHTEQELLDKILDEFQKTDAPSLSLDFYRYKKRKGQPTDNVLIEPPNTPKRVDGIFPQPETPWTKKNTTISTVVFFTNDCAEDHDFRLEMNLQGNLPPSDTCEDVREWLKQGGGNYKGLDSILQNDEHEGGCEYYADFEIWVLPQTRSRKTDMYCWSKDPTRKASSFMEQEHAEKYGYELYLEVAIIQDENWEQKKKIRDEELRKDPARAQKIEAARKQKGWDKAESEVSLRKGVPQVEQRMSAKIFSNSRTTSGIDDLESNVFNEPAQADDEDFMMDDNADSESEEDEDGGSLKGKMT
ncbi:hypothetical protein AC579_10373, partial [Pseudocercospora musae]